MRMFPLIQLRNIHLRDRTGLRKVKVVAPPSHDTASAVAGVPTANTGQANWAYLSSGTWSLMGVEVQKASLSARTQELNLTNEGGLDGTYRLLKNIMGLWLVQQCKRAFDARGRKYDYSQLAQMAAKAPALRSIVNPDDSRFLNPPDMPKAIQDFCRETRQPVPKTRGRDGPVRLREPRPQISRSAWAASRNSLATTSKSFTSWEAAPKSAILNQFTADACQRPVVTGPVEATAMGNLLVQVRASGEFSSLAEMREMIRKSSDVTTCRPGKPSAWEAASVRFAELTKAQ